MVRPWMVFGCLSGLCECLEASLGLEPRLPVDRNLYSDRVSEYREAYPVRRRIRTHQAWKWSPGKVVCLELDWL